MKWWLVAALATSCATTPPLRETPPETPHVDPAAEQRAVLDAFLHAVETQRFDDALQWLSKSWRDRYDGAQLARDFEVDPRAVDRVALLRSHRGDAFVVAQQGSTLPLAQGRALQLVLEPQGWRIAALE